MEICSVKEFTIKSYEANNPLLFLVEINPVNEKIYFQII